MGERLRAVPADRLHLWLMLVLTFTTGINDAVGYLGLDKVFTGNMTGNVVILGMALVPGSGLPILGPALALVGFLVGAAIGGRALRDATTSWNGATTVMFGLVGAVLVALAGVLFVVGEDPSRELQITVTTTAAAAMGLQAAVARHVAVKDVTTVVVTSTLTGLAADSYFGTGRSEGWIRRAAAVALILLGATAGAGLLQLHVAAGLIVAGVVIASVAAVGEWHRRLTTS